MFELYQRFKDLLYKLWGLKAKASTDWLVLNQFLTDDNFDPMFTRSLDGIGVVSILDMLVKWLHEAVRCQIQGKDGQEHIGFEIPGVGRQIFRVESLSSPLVRLLTKNGDSLWLTMPRSEPSSKDLIPVAFTAMSEVKDASKLYDAPVSYSTVKVPEISFDLKPDISFLVGANTLDANEDYWFISKAKQQFKLKVSKEGARVRAATGLGISLGMSTIPRVPLVFDRPFIGWFTQESVPTLPIAVFYADYDCWQEAGDLQDM